MLTICFLPRRSFSFRYFTRLLKVDIPAICLPFGVFECECKYGVPF